MANHPTARNTSPDDIYDAPLEKAFDRIVTPFEEFIHNQATSGLLLMGSAVLALFIANSPLAHGYEEILNTVVGFRVGGWTFGHSVHHWINDGLMAMFFFVVGLEIKREILVGELSEPRQAALPILAALGGMIVPAVIFTLFNAGSDTARGWGIPMATDIAFAVGALVLLGKGIPRSLVTFLVALAIVDDLGSVVVIALFYTEQIHLGALGLAAGLVALLVLFNLSGIRRPLPYFLAGGLLWLAMLESGVHATIAGVLTALAIPARPKYHPGSFTRRVRTLMDRFDETHDPRTTIITNEGQRALLQTLENCVHRVETPLQRLEHQLHFPVAYGIIPVFALANAGIPIDFTSLSTTLSNPLTLGVVVGLIAGKLAGIAGVSWLALQLGVGRLPQGTRFSQIVGVALLGGIGFTMSIFIGELAFPGQTENLLMAKSGILLASVIAGVGGYLVLRFAAPAK
jgi:NhaA family Na+:H+ antiporter